MDWTKGQGQPGGPRAGVGGQREAVETLGQREEPPGSQGARETPNMAF